MSLRSFIKDKRGNIAVLFSIMLVPVLSAVAFSIDFANNALAKRDLQNAADNAVLASLACKDTDTYKCDRKKIAQDFFNQSVAGLKGITILGVNYNIDPTGREASIDFKAKTGVVYKGNSLTSLYVNGTSKAAYMESASTNMSQYELFFVLDASESMFVASTTAERNRLVTLTDAVGDKCVYACHVPVAGWGSKSYLQIARENGVNLRIDVMRTAVNSLIDRLKSTKVYPDHLRTTVLSFADRYYQGGGSAKYQKIISKEKDLSRVKTVISDMAIGGDTMTSDALSQIVSEVGKQGDGQTPEASKKYVILVTDGLQGNANNGWGYTDRYPTKAFDSSWCAPYKANGVTVVVLYTKYLGHIPWYPWTGLATAMAYANMIEAMIPSIESNLKSCASPGYFFMASDTTEINDAMGKIFSAITFGNAVEQKLRLVK